MSAPRRRREGFHGQRLYVVPDPVRASALRHPLLRGLLVTDAGYFPAARGHWVERPRGAPTHLLMACMSGAGVVESAGRAQNISAGDLVWLPANEAHTYGADRAQPWTLCWAHFTGDEAQAWRELLGWAAARPFGAMRLPPDRLGDLRLDDVHDALHHGYSIPQLVGAAVALRQAFSAALHLGRLAGPVRSAAERVAAVAAQLRAAPARAHRLPELAAAAGLSVPHFSHLFRRQTGYAPVDYLIRQRIRRACELLDTTDAPVAEIAAEVGYDDPYYFTRSFRRVMGRPPREYRRVVKG